MLPENVLSQLFLGDDVDYELFKIAITLAENGRHVWLISPKPVTKLPEGIETPIKDVLQLITFIYLKDHHELLTHLNGIHLWHKTPKVVIVSGFERYIDLQSENYNALLSGLLMTSLLDCVGTSARKTGFFCYLIVACAEGHPDRLKVLRDMYFESSVRKLGESSEVFQEILRNCLS